MDEHLSIPSTIIHRDDQNRKRSMIKTYSFTTDDDDQMNKRKENVDQLALIQKKIISQQKTNVDETSRNFFKTFLCFSLFVVFISILFVERERWFPQLIRSRQVKKLSEIDRNPKFTRIEQEKQEDHDDDVDVEENKKKKKKEKEKTTTIESSLSLTTNEYRRNKREENSLEKKSSFRTISHRIRNFNETKVNPNVILLKSDDFLEDLRKELKHRCENRKILDDLLKSTGLNKDQLRKFIYEKNSHVLHLDSFLSLLDYFHLMILILPK